MHAVLVVNPRSNRGRTQRRWRDMEPLIRRSLPESEVVLTEGPGHATELARKAVLDNTPLVVAVGGDGTNNEVVNGFFDANCEPIACDSCFGFIGCGTGSDFGRGLGHGGGLKAAAERIAKTDPRTIDLGRITYIDHSGQQQRRIFLNIASFGISGLVDRRVNAKTSGGGFAYLMATLSAIFQYSNQSVELEIDGQKQNVEELTLCTIANGRYFGGGMQIAPHARVDDGRFDVIQVWGWKSLGFLANSPRVYSGSHLELRGVSEERASLISAQASGDQEVLIDLDGEQPGRLPASFEILPNSLRLRG